MVGGQVNPILIIINDNNNNNSNNNCLLLVFIRIFHDDYSIIYIWATRKTASTMISNN